MNIGTLQPSPTRPASVRQSNPPALLLIGNFLSGTGLNPTTCEPLAERLTRAGWQVFTTSRYLNPGLRLADMLTMLWKVRHKFSVAHIDVYSGRAFIWAEATAWLLRRLGKPYILSLHGGNLPTFFSRYPARVSRLLQSANVVTTPSEYLRSAFRSCRADIVQLPNAVDIEKYPFRSRSVLRPRLIWLRAFSQIYNPTLAPRVLANLLPRYPDAFLEMIGPDKRDGSWQATQRVAAKLGVNDRIQFCAGIAKNDVPERLDNCDIFINTTDVDNTPVTVVEAMACGLCVASTDVGGLPFLLKDNRTALLVPPQDSVAMADAVSRLLSDQQLAQQLSTAGRDLVAGWDWSLVLPKWESLFTDLWESRTFLTGR